MKKKWIDYAFNCSAYISFEGVSSDYRTVMAKISLSGNVIQTSKATHYDRSLLNNRDITDRYTITLRNKFDELQEISETLIPNENLVNALMEAAAERIPTKLRTKHRLHGAKIAARKKTLTIWRPHPYAKKGTQLTPTLRNIRKHEVN